MASVQLPALPALRPVEEPEGIYTVRVTRYPAPGTPVAGEGLPTETVGPERDRPSEPGVSTVRCPLGPTRNLPVLDVEGRPTRVPGQTGRPTCPGRSPGPVPTIGPGRRRQVPPPAQVSGSGRGLRRQTRPGPRDMGTPGGCERPEVS